MSMRSAVRTLDAVETPEGHGMVVRRAMPNHGLRMVDPFLVLDHMGPQEFVPGDERGFPDHPHRGFETVTLVLEGELEHKDSQGNRGLLGPGDVQWMTAGDGVVHSEMPSPRLRREGGRMQGLQLWVNLPGRLKRVRPRYQDVRAADVPGVELPDGAGNVRVVAGAFDGREGAAAVHTPVTLLHARLAPGGGVELPVPEGHNAFLYAVQGSGRAGGAPVREAQLTLLGTAGDAVQARAAADGLEILLATGAAIREPVYQWGPFVMTRQEEIVEAVRDFQEGRMGGIPAEVR